MDPCLSLRANEDEHKLHFIGSVIHYAIAMIYFNTNYDLILKKIEKKKTHPADAR